MVLYGIYASTHTLYFSTEPLHKLGWAVPISLEGSAGGLCMVNHKPRIRSLTVTPYQDATTREPTVILRSLGSNRIKTSYPPETPSIQVPIHRAPGVYAGHPFKDREGAPHLSLYSSLHQKLCNEPLVTAREGEHFCLEFTYKMHAAPVGTRLTVYKAVPCSDANPIAPKDVLEQKRCRILI